LLTVGLVTVLGLQTIIILGGNVRLLPLTGITLPFVSAGGSSLITNFLIVGLLLRASEQARG
jgi:cell division protein FtsW (lipid II flippase)